MSLWTGAVSTDWNTAGNWAVGGTGIGVPSATVDAIFSGTPVRACVLGANRTCRAFTFTAYTSTVDLATFTLTTNNNVTFQVDQSSRILGTTATLFLGAAATITSNAGTWSLNFQIANFGVTPVVLADNMRVSGSYLSSGGSRVINGFSLFVGTNLTSSTTHSGTTNFIMNGSGTYTGTGLCNLEIDTSGTIIITGSITLSRRFIITNVGTITMTAANVLINDTTTVNLGGRTIGDLSHAFGAAGIITYLTDVYCSNFTIGNGTNTYNGPGNIYASGNYNLGTGSLGSLVVTLTGSGTISTGTMGLRCVIASSGTYTLGATLTIGNNFTYTSGAVNAGTGTVTLNSVTMNTLGVNWYNITTAANTTVTISSLLSITNTLAITSGTTTFTGTAGWTCGAWTCSTAGTIIVLQSGITCTTITNVTMLGTNASRITIRSNAPTVSYAIWTLQNPATQSMVYVNGQGVNSNAGMTIYSFGGDVLTSLPALNWYNGASQGTKAFTYVS